jgi:hypothetical protein
LPDDLALLQQMLRKRCAGAIWRRAAPA